MKKLIVLIAAALAFSAPAAFAADHGSMDMGHGSMDMGHSNHSMMEMGNVAHQEVIDGVKATFKVIDIHQKMKAMGMKETHHIMVMFSDARTKKMLNGGEATIKVIAPDKSEQIKDLLGMEGGFGSDFSMPAMGKYGVLCKFQLKDGKVRHAKFWYTVK